MSLEIESLTPAYAAVLATLHASAFEQAWPEEAFVRLLSDGPRYGAIASKTGTPAGFILLQRLPDEDEVLTLSVDPAQRRSGVARELMGWAIKSARRGGKERIVLDVSESNEAALGLYLGLGFVEVGRRSGYYARRQGLETALILALDLGRLFEDGRPGTFAPAGVGRSRPGHGD
jgi:ribosomal-protein-alanine N-acetyltransferase